VLQQVEQVYKALIKEKNLSYTLRYDNNIPHQLIGDPVRLTQVFTNLINNGIKFTPEGGSIILSAELVARSDKTAQVFFVVADTGIGIPSG